MKATKTCRNGIVALVVMAMVFPALAAESQPTVAKKWSPVVNPKPLSQNVLKALGWLVAQQQENGGWGQGGESSSMNSQGNIAQIPNVADTCVATLAMIRAGSTPSSGTHAPQINRALEFVCTKIEESDEASLFITDVRGTRVQSKLGTYIDTFLAGVLLPEVKDQMPNQASTQRVAAALDKVMMKIQRNQRQDGTWDDNGWAPALAQAMASKALNRAVQAGVRVDEAVRERTEKYARDSFDQASGRISGGGSAGVELYAYAANVGALQDSDNTNAQLEVDVRVKMQRPAAKPAEREEAAQMIERFKKAKQELSAMKSSLIDKLGDDKFVKGFGSNGGEEFLSYMNLGESLVVSGGNEWKAWDERITQNLNRVQNADGSWTGHHCITGRTFCTAAALLVLTVDRAPVPLAAQIKG